MRALKFDNFSYEIVEISDNFNKQLKDIHKYIDGYFETVFINNIKDKQLFALVDEHGLDKQLPPVLIHKQSGEQLLGTVLFACTQNGNFVGINDKEIEIINNIINNNFIHLLLE